MTFTQTKLANRDARNNYEAVANYCRSADMRLSKDDVTGYWLHYDGKMRYCRLLSEIRGLVDYLNS